MSGQRPVAPDLSDGPVHRLDSAQIRARLTKMTNLEHAATLLGFRLLEFSIEDGWLEAEFNPSPQVSNLRGGVQGGMMCAMLDEVMSLAVLVDQGFTVGVPTLEMKTSFLAPLPLARCKARGQALRVGRNVAFMEGTIWTGDGIIAAKGTATCQVRRPRALRDPA
tara:strand:+ start:1859 stop:2353 length:495 start_codon:yes stop_codon:yes gene_type:complete